MSNSVNTSVVNLSQNNNTPADQYFNNYFVTPNTISSNQNDAVVAYFQQYTGGNTESAAILASNIIYTAMSQGMDPMDIIQQFQALPAGQLSWYLAMFLNLNRIGTSIVGVNNNQTQNKYITRAILA
jgi:hypothetical protein